MISVVLYKYVIYPADKTFDTGSTTKTDRNTNYRAVLLMMLFISSCCNNLKTDQSREICTRVTPSNAEQTPW